MKAGTIHILDLDFELKLWKNRLLNFQSELDIIDGRVFVLAREHPGFILNKNHQILIQIQKERVKGTLIKIENMEQEMALYAEDYPINEKHLHFVFMKNIREEIENILMKQNQIISEVFPELCYPKK